MKRFTETDKWRDVWYRKLTPVQKCLWHYLCDNCDPAGVIDLDVELASFQIGARLTSKDIEALAKGIATLSGGKLWVRAFVRFQFGQLSEACKPHLHVLAALKKHGIEPSTCYESHPNPVATLIIPLAKGSPTLEDKDKDKDKDKETDSEPKPTPADIYAQYPRKVGKPKAIEAITKALKSQSFDYLMDRTTAFAAAVKLWPAGEEQFVPHPSTWFNQGRYDDDPQAWVKTVPVRPGQKPQPEKKPFTIAGLFADMGINPNQPTP